MGGKWKLGLGIGCGLAVLVVVGVLGVATWYAGTINKEYKEVRDSEKAVLAATEGDQGYSPPQGGIPAPDRIEVFLEVRKDLVPWRRTMASASGQFATDRERQRAGGIKDLLRVVNTGSDLMPVYAGFWVARNQTLLEHGMGPGEYAYIYRLVYYTWLKREPPAEWVEDLTDQTLSAAFMPFRERLLEAYDAEVDPVELIFQEDRK
jgi:hypothetical protein